MLRFCIVLSLAFCVFAFPNNYSKNLFVLAVPRLIILVLVSYSFALLLLLHRLKRAPLLVPKRRACSFFLSHKHT